MAASSPSGASRPSRTSLRAALALRLSGAAGMLPVPLLLACRPGVAGALRLAPGLRVRVERTMTAALGREAVGPAVVDAYFDNIARMIAQSAAVYRSGAGGIRVVKQSWKRDLHFQKQLAECVGRVREGLERGKGAVLVVPHTIGHELLAGLFAEELPLTVFVRKSPDPGYERIKQRWYAALGLETIYRPPRTSPHGPLEEMTAAVRCLRKNRLLALTPDLLMKPGHGVPVHLFGRPAEIPAGPFYLASRMGTPLGYVFDCSTPERFRVDGSELVPSSGDRDEAMAALAQEWVGRFEEYLRARPDRWQFWLDKRWARWLEAEEAVRCG